MGTPHFAVPSLAILVGKTHEIAAVVTQPDRPAGRGRVVAPPPVKAYALQHGLFVLQPQKIKDPAFLSDLQALKPDLIVVVAFGRILPPQILKVPPKGCVNVHASLLPQYRGAAPVQWAIIRGETMTGVTTMLMDEGMDTGPILLQEKTSIGSEETAGQLAERLSQMGADLLAQTVQGIDGGEVLPIPQENHLATYAPVIKKEDGQIKWDQDALSIYNFIRGMDPWPGAFTFYRGKRWRICRAEVVKEVREPWPPGRILEVTPGGIRVMTGSGALAIAELQPENSRRMTVQAYLAGHPIKSGEILGPEVS